MGANRQGVRCESRIGYDGDVIRTAVVVQSPDWKSEAQKNFWSSNFMKSVESVKYLKARYEESRAVLADLGLGR